MKNYGRSLITAIDIGTTKIGVFIAQPINDHTLDIIGIGKAPSAGIAKGVVVDIAQAVQSIKAAVKEAELMAGVRVELAYIGISGAHIQSTTSHGMVPIKGNIVKISDMAAALSAARAISISEGQQILHVLPQNYVIDGYHEVADPLGLHCMRLEVRAHIITGSVASVQNLVRCCQAAGVSVHDVVLEPLASAYAVLSQDERALGVGILDIGGGTSDFALYHQGAIKHTKILPIAGNHVTQDIALCLRTTLQSAEQIKQMEGSALIDTDLDIGKNFEVEMVQGDQHKLITLKDLVAVIEPRIEELLYMVHHEIKEHNLRSYMPAGLVLTGGGSLLKHIEDHAVKILSLPVRCGLPSVPPAFQEIIKSPTNATGYGLLLYALKNNYNCFNDYMNGPLITRIFSRMKTWVTDFF